MEREKLYWVAEIKGRNWKRLKDMGFVVLRPAVSDYVFIEQSEENQKWWKKQDELGIKMLHAGKKPMIVREQEVQQYRASLKAIFTVGSKVTSSLPELTNLDGTVIENGAGTCLVHFQGWRRQYERIVSWEDLLPKNLSGVVITESNASLSPEEKEWGDEYSL